METDTTSENDSLSDVESEEDMSSVLGTQTFWNKQYETELENFKDYGDIGDVWFGKRVMDLMVNWVVKNVDKSANLLDLGCGNGVLLISLAQKEFENLVGVDYSEPAVMLAEQIAKDKNARVSFQTVDVISVDPIHLQPTTYDVILDKGTFDAITLMEGFGPGVRDRYVKNVSALLKDNGHFVIATCNWTKDEIVQHMSASFSMLELLPTPTLQFGGKQGNNVTVVVFRKQ